MFVFVALVGAVTAILQANTGQLLFSTAWPLLFLAAFLGLLVAGRTKRYGPIIEEDRVLRHDGAARLEHWTHGIGTAALIVTGILLGVWFTPALVKSGEPVWLTMNLHFVAAWFFIFGSFFYLADTIISWHRLKAHVPTKNFFSFTVQHYGHMLGFKRFHMPPEAKYYESEKLAYLIAVLSVFCLIVTGIFKVLAHATLGLPPTVMHVMFIVHDVAGMLILLFLLAHVFFGAIIPDSWPGLHAMLSGYVSLDKVKKDYPGWYPDVLAFQAKRTESSESVSTDAQPVMADEGEE